MVFETTEEVQEQVVVDTPEEADVIEEDAFEQEFIEEDAIVSEIPAVAPAASYGGYGAFATPDVFVPDEPNQSIPTPIFT